MVRFTVDNRNRLVFYGNMVGYVKENAAVVDEMFQTDELTRYLTRLNLTAQWEDGIFDRLAAGEVPSEELGQPRKGCRRSSTATWGPTIWSRSMPSAGMIRLPDTRATVWRCRMWWSCTTIPAANFITATVWASALSGLNKARIRHNASK